MADQTITIRIMATAKQARNELRATTNEVERTGASVQRAGVKAAAGMGTVTQAAVIAGGAIIAGFAAAMAVGAAAAIQFEQQFVRVAKTVEGTRPQLLGVADDLDLLARKKIPMAVSELLAMAEVGGQLGISADGIEGFTETVAKLTSATNLAANQAGTNLARFANIMGNTEKEFEQLGAVVVELGNNLPTTEAEIFSMGQALAPVAATFNTTSDSVLALAGALSASGQSAERSATAIQRTFMDMQSAVMAGGHELQEFANVAGMTTEQFSRLFQTDAVEALAAVTAGLARITDEGDSATQALGKLGIKEARSLRVLLALANNTDLMADALGRAEGQWNDATALNEEAEKAFRTTSGTMKQLGNAAIGLARDLGDGLLPEIRNVAVELTDFANDGDNRSLFERIGEGAGNFVFNLRTIGQGLETLAEGVKQVGSGGIFMQSGRDIIGYEEQLTIAMGKMGEFIHEHESMADEIQHLPSLLEQIAGDNPRALPAMLEEIQTRYMLTTEEMREYLKELQHTGQVQRFAANSMEAIGDAIIDLEGGFQPLQRHTKAWKEETDRLSSALTHTQRVMAELRNETHTLAEGIQNAKDAMHDSIGSVNDYNSSVDSLIEAYADLGAEGGNTIENLDAMVGALLDAEAAANALAEGGVSNYIKKLQMMNNVGLLTDEQLQRLTDRLFDNMRAHEILSIATQGATISFADLRAQASALDVTTQALIGKLWGINDAFIAGITSASQYASALWLAFEASQALANPDNILGEKQFLKQSRNAGAAGRALADSIKGTFGDIGETLGGVIDAGIARGIGGGGAASSAAEEAGENAAEAFISGMRANLNLDDARTELDDIKQTLMDLQEEYKTSFNEYWDTFRDLREARKAAAQITTRESRDLLSAELDLLNTEKQLGDLRKEQASIPSQMAAAQNELAAAQERYNQALLDADRMEQANKANLTSALSDVEALTRGYGNGQNSFADLIQSERRLAAELAASGDADQARADAATEYADAQESASQTLEDLRFRQKEIALELQIAELDLLIGREDLTQAMIDAVGPTQEVLDLEERLIEINERRRDIRKEVTEGERDLLEAELDLLEATIAYNEAFNEMIEISPEGIGAFAQLTETVLGSGSAVGNLVPKLVNTGTAFDGLKTIASAAADSAEASAARAANAVMSALQSAQRAASAASVPASQRLPMNPTSTGVYIAHQGAYFPGPTTQEYLTLVRGGEMVLDSNMIAKAVAQGLGGANTSGSPSTIVVQLDGKEISRHVTSGVESDMRTARRMS